MNVFEVGDRVYARYYVKGSLFDRIELGTIIGITHKNSKQPIYEIELDEPLSDHDCDGKTKPNHGAYAITLYKAYEDLQVGDKVEIVDRFLYFNYTPTHEIYEITKIVHGGVLANVDGLEILFCHGEFIPAK